jgi:hypothetical protein
MDHGQFYLKFTNYGSKFKEVLDTFCSIEDYLIKKDNRIKDCHYWAIGDKYPNFLVVTKNNKMIEDHASTENYISIKEQFPNFFALLDELGLSHYLGRTTTSDWGIHRHIYNMSSKWNICYFDKNNKDATVNFYKIYDEWVAAQFQNTYFDSLQFKDVNNIEKVESVLVNDGEVYCFLPEQWHSHLSNTDNKNLSTFLLHFKNAVTYEDVLNNYKGINDCYK